MPPKKKVEQRQAVQGQNMIELRIRFWTNDLADMKGMVRPKHAWSSGVVHLARNDSHGIGPQKPMVFHSLMYLTAVIEKVLIANGITLHVSRKMGKYFEEG